MEVGKERKRTEERAERGRRKTRRKNRKEKGRKEGQDNKTRERQRRRNEGEEETGGEERIEETKEEQDGGTEGWREEPQVEAFNITGGVTVLPGCRITKPQPPHNHPHAATPHNTVS